MAQNAIALGLLQSLKESINGEQVVGFEYRPDFGICWHLFANHKAIGADFLREAFDYLGLDEEYPVEVLEGYNSKLAAEVYHSNVGSRYDDHTVNGLLRVQLLEKLIEYFATLVKQELEKI